VALRVDRATQASLVVATLDLQLVRLIRGAIRAADLAEGKVGALAGVPLPSIRRDGRLSAAPSPPERFHPTPRFEPRPVVHPTPRIESRPVYHDRIDIDVAASDTSSPRPRPVNRTPLPAPWQMPVWGLPIQPAPKVKVHLHRVDVHNKGSLIDLFC
jgi:hypothetical protein